MNKAQKLSAYNSYSRAARFQLVKHLVEVLGMNKSGLKVKKAIKIFAEHYKLEVTGNSVKWLIDLYLSRANPFICRRAIEEEPICLRDEEPKEPKPIYRRKVEKPRYVTSDALRMKQKLSEVYKKSLRINATKAEKHLKREMTMRGIKFVFQKAYYTEKLMYIADFYLKTYTGNYVIELDGGYHNTESQRIKDENRTRWMEANRNVRVLRFTNDDAILDTNYVIGKILDLRPKFKTKQ